MVMNRFCSHIAIALAASLSVGPAIGAEQHPISVLVADFDYDDTSGEVRDQRLEHLERVKAFGNILRERIAAEDRYEVVPAKCPQSPCTARTLNPKSFVDMARKSGARIVIYGGIQKMSTLVQWGKIHVLDLEREKLLLDRLFSFRGDTDDAFRKAAEAISKTLKEVTPPA